MIEKRGFTSGMNQDLAEGFLQEGMYRYALNIRNGNSERGAVGAITNEEGNREISFTLPSGGNRVIGAYDDEANDRVIYIVYNNNGNNRILSYDYKEGVIKTIVADSGNVLDLNPEYLVTGINVVAGDGASYLLFTDNWGEPKNINIEQGIRTYDTNVDSGGGYIYRKFLGDFDTVSPTVVNNGDVYSRDVYITATSGSPAQITLYYRAKNTTTNDPTSSTSSYTPQSSWEICPAGYIYGTHVAENFTNIVKPLITAPETSYTTTGADYNFLDGNLYQYKVKCVKSDGRESSWSSISSFITAPTQLDSLINIDSYNNSRQLFNAINLYIDLPDITTYKSVKVAVRRAMNDNSPSDWQLAETVTLNNLDGLIYTSNLKISYIFDGSKATMPLDSNEVSQLMSWIPKKAKAQSITSKNRILYSNFTEGLPYSLDGVYDINQLPPIVTFYERDNPYNTLSDSIELYDYDGTTIGSLITEETEFSPSLSNPDGLAFKFPSTIKAGVQYKISMSIEYGVLSTRYSPTRLLDSKSKSSDINIIAATSAVTNLLDSFVDNINQSSDFYIYKERGEVWDDTLVTASSANSGSDYYLIVQPKSISTAETYIRISPKIKDVPTSSVGTTTIASQSFKRGTQQTFAIAYSDKYGRLSTAIEHSNLSVYNPWWRDSAYSGSAAARAGNDFDSIGLRYAEIELNHDAPNWADKYHILKTNSNGVNSFISFPLSKTVGLPNLTNGSSNPLDSKYFYRGFIRRDFDKTDSATTLTADSVQDTELIYIPLTSLQNSVVGYTNLNDSPLAYDYSSGDRVRFCYYLLSTSPHAPTSASQYYTAEADAEIMFYDSELNAIAIRPNDLPNELVGASGIFAKANEAGASGAPGSTAIRGLLCEIYSPTKEKSPEFYYEMFTGDINYNSTDDRYYHVGNEQTQTSAQSAVIELTNGDCFLKPRTYVWKSDLANLSASASTQTFDYFVEEANYYDKVPSKTWGAGRPNRSIKSTSQSEDITGFLGEVQRPTTIRYSEPFLPDQGYNGLGTIYDLNFKDANAALKSIQHLHTEGSRTIVLHENAVGFAESDRAVVTTLDGNNMTIGANTPLSDIVYYSTRAGIGLNPESFAFSNNRKYFVDVDQGQVCRLSQDGVTPISEKGMESYFKGKFRDVINSPLQSTVYGAYDKRTDEYVLNIRNKVAIELENTSDATLYNYPLSGTPLGDCTLQYVFDNVSIYDIYEGGYVDIFYPAGEYTIQTDSAGSTTTIRIDDTTFSTYVTTISGNSVNMFIPEEHQDALWAFFNPNLPLVGIVPPLKIYVDESTTISFSERLNAWTSFHSWNPEEMCSAGVDFVSFKAGSVYVHDDYDNPHSYYGTDYPAYIDIISNGGSPDTIKIWKTLGIKATTEADIVNEDDFSVALSAADTTDSVEPVNGGVVTSNGKVSTGSTPVYKEDQVYFHYMRTSSGTTFGDFLEGDKVRGYWQKTRIKIAAGIDKIYKVISTNFDVIMSNYTR